MDVVEIQSKIGTRKTKNTQIEMLTLYDSRYFCEIICCYIYNVTFICRLVMKLVDPISIRCLWKEKYPTATADNSFFIISNVGDC